MPAKQPAFLYFHRKIGKTRVHDVRVAKELYRDSSQFSNLLNYEIFLDFYILIRVVLLELRICFEKKNL